MSGLNSAPASCAKASRERLKQPSPRFRALMRTRAQTRPNGSFKTSSRAMLLSMASNVSFKRSVKGFNSALKEASAWHRVFHNCGVSIFCLNSSSLSTASLFQKTIFSFIRLIDPSFLRFVVYRSLPLRPQPFQAALKNILPYCYPETSGRLSSIS